MSFYQLTWLAMASFSPLPQFAGSKMEDPYSKIALAGLFVVLLVASTVILTVYRAKVQLNPTVRSFYDFFYTSFIKPHEQDEGGGQQSALESFYKTQVSTLAINHRQTLMHYEPGLCI